SCKPMPYQNLSSSQVLATGLGEPVIFSKRTGTSLSKALYMPVTNRRTKILGILIAHLGLAGLFFSASPATSSNRSAATFDAPIKLESESANAGQPAKKDYTKFTHASHDGTLTIPESKKTVDLKCGTCHAVTKEKPEPNSYPVEDLSLKQIPRAGTKHSAC